MTSVRFLGSCRLNLMTSFIVSLLNYQGDNANVLQVKRFIGVIQDETNLEVALNVLNDFERIVAPHARALRRGCCHGDLNDQNVLVTIVSPSVADDFFSPGQRPVSKKALPWAVLDFGDIVVTWIVNEIAVAAAYFSLGNDDPVGACCEIVTGYGTCCISQIQALFYRSW